MPEYYQPKRRRLSPVSGKRGEPEKNKKKYSRQYQDNYRPPNPKPSAPASNIPRKKKKNGKIKNKLRKEKYVEPPISPFREKIDDDLRMARDKKRRRKRNYIYYYIMLAITAVVVVSVLSVTVLFNVTDVMIEGKCRYTVDELKYAGGIGEDVNLIRLDAAAAEKAIIEKLVFIDSIEVRKDFPSTITFVVSNATTAADLLVDGIYYSMSPRGRILQASSTPDEDTIIFEGLSRTLLPETGDYIDFENSDGGKLIYTLFEKIKSADLGNIVSVNIENKLGIVINYDNRVIMQVGSTMQLDEKLSAAKTLIEQEIDPDEHVTLLLNNPEKVASRPLNASNGTFNASLENSDENGEETEETEESITEEPVASETDDEKPAETGSDYES